MRVLFDQGTPVPLRQALSDHHVVTAYELGWATLKNGELLLATTSWPRIRQVTDQVQSAVQACLPGAFVELPIP